MLGKSRRISQIPIAAGPLRVLNRRDCVARFAAGQVGVKSSARQMSGRQVRAFLSVRSAVSEVTVLSAVRQRGAMPLRGRSYMAFSLTPQAPIADWLDELDSWLRGASGFFDGRPVVLDLSAVTLTSPGIVHLVSELGTRGVRIMGLEGVGADRLGPNLPPLVNGGRSAPLETVNARAVPAPQPEKAKASTSLLVDHPVRSGQAIFHPDGDVTVLGSVGSGAEVMAGGSIHIYGALRGRAMAGTSGDRKARIYCTRLHAELLAIDGYYRTAEHLETNLVGRPAQAWLTEETLNIAEID
jgi:septum site-determining protein MinC